MLGAVFGRAVEADVLVICRRINKKNVGFVVTPR